jgi:hypothetical protein
VTQAELKLERRAAGDAGWSWLESQLAQGPLSRALLGIQVIRAGQLYAYVSSDKRLRGERDFDESLGLPPPTSTDARLVHTAAEDARASGGDFVVLETSVPRRLFRQVTDWNGHAMSDANVSFHREWVLPWWPVKTMAAPALHDLVDKTGFLISGRDLAPRPLEELTELRVTELAQATKSVLVSAFDGESFLVWLAP